MVIVQHPQVVTEKIGRLSIDRLHVIADFDKTLTKAFYDGRKHQSSISLVRDGGYLSSQYVSASKALFAKYHPIEVDPHIALEKKSAAMQKWWSEHWDLMIKSGMNKGVIEDIVSKDLIVGRQYLADFLGALYDARVPVLILSAGIGNIIEEFLTRAQLYSDNVTLLSNKFEWGPDGRAVRYSTPLIHSFNKGEAMLPKGYFGTRDQVLLLGDTLGDLDMSNHAEHSEELTVGFANDDSQVNTFSEKYDVVIPNDGSLEWVVGLIEKLKART